MNCVRKVLSFCDDNGFLTGVVSFPTFFLFACFGQYACSMTSACEMMRPGFVWSFIFLASAYNAALANCADANVRFPAHKITFYGSIDDRLMALGIWIMTALILFFASWIVSVIQSLPSKPNLAEVLLCTTAPFAVASHVVATGAKIYNAKNNQRLRRVERIFRTPISSAIPPVAISDITSKRA